MNLAQRFSTGLKLLVMMMLLLPLIVSSARSDSDLSYYTLTCYFKPEVNAQTETFGLIQENDRILIKSIGKDSNVVVLMLPKDINTTAITERMKSSGILKRLTLSNKVFIYPSLDMIKKGKVEFAVGFWPNTFPSRESAMIYLKPILSMLKVAMKYFITYLSKYL